MKIAMFGHKRIPSRLGGVEVVVEELSARMVQLGHVIVCYDRGGQGRRTHRGVEIRPVPTLRGKGVSAVVSGFFAAVCCAFSDADVVHIHGEGPAFWCRIPKRFGKRVVVTVHGLDWQREKWRGSFGRTFLRMGEAEAVGHADRIIVLSRNMQAYFRDAYGRETVWIPNGISRPQIQSAQEITKRLGLKKDSYFLFLGRLVPEKGVHCLIEAYRRVETDKKLVIAGASSDTDAYAQRLRELAEGDGRILFTGFVQGRLLEELYSNAYVYVLPSDLEGMPLSLLEAMSYGNCCLISDIPECTEVTEEKAVCFSKGNVDDLREKLQMLCADSRLVQTCREQTQNHACGKFSWEETVDKTLEQYQ